MKLNQVQPSEANVVLEMLKDSAKDLKDKGLDQWGYWINPPKERIDWIHAGVLNGEFFFVLSEQDRIMAMYRLLFEDELYWGKQKEKAGYVHSLVVKKEFQGQHLGTTIMKKIESFLVAQHISLFRLDCVSSNSGLCRYYERLGFKKVGEKQMPLSLNNLYEKALLT